MKTILLPIYNGIRAKNFFYTYIYTGLTGEPNLRLVIVIPPSKLAFYQKEFGRPNVVFEPLEIVSESRFGRILCAIAFNFLDTDSVRLKQWWTYLKYGHYGKFLLKRAANLAFSGFKFPRSIIRFLDGFVALDPGVVKILERYRPDLVIVPDIVFPPDRIFLRAAKRKKFFVLGTIRAWDNLTSKGVIQLLPDKLIVHTHIMKELAVRLAGMPEEYIYVSGIPHYDIFFKPPLKSREKFLKMLGIPPERKIVLAAPFLYSHTSSSLKIINELTSAIDDGRLPKDTQILVRYRPGTPPIDEKLFRPSQNLTITKPCSQYFPVRNIQMSTKDWEFSPEDFELLMNSLYWSDVTINTMSTLSIDAAVFDKPVINVRFDADPQTPPKHSVSVLLKHDHYKSIEASGGVKRVWNMGELVEAVRRYLEDPSLDREGRKRMVEEQVEFTDGLSGRRTADYIKRILYENF